MNQLKLSRSVDQYLTKLAFSTGVNAIVNAGIDPLPEGLNWEELLRYYSAFAAAMRVVADNAIDSKRLWDAVWRDVPVGWIEMSHDDQAFVKGWNAGVGPGEVFKGGFIRCFSRAGQRRLKLEIWANQKEVGLGLSLSQIVRTIEQPIKVDIDGFDYEEDGQAHYVRHPLRIKNRMLDISEARDSAVNAMTLVENALAER